jgi:hypothetical protein
MKGERPAPIRMRFYLWPLSKPLEEMHRLRDFRKSPVWDIIRQEIYRESEEESIRSPGVDPPGSA